MSIVNCVITVFIAVSHFSLEISFDSDDAAVLLIQHLSDPYWTHQNHNTLF